MAVDVRRHQALAPAERSKLRQASSWHELGAWKSLVYPSNRYNLSGELHALYHNSTELRSAQRRPELKGKQRAASISMPPPGASSPAPTIEPYTYLAFSPPARTDPGFRRFHDRKGRPKANVQDDSIYSVTQQIQSEETSRCAITLLSSWRWPAFWPRPRCLHPDRFWRKALEKCSSRRISGNCCLPACSIADNRQRRSCATPEASSLTTGSLCLPLWSIPAVTQPASRPSTRPTSSPRSQSKSAGKTFLQASTAWASSQTTNFW